jgi:hypothetical protein
MSTYTLLAGDVAAYEKTLVATTVDTVQFARAVEAVEIYTDGTSSIYFTLDGSAPTVGGATTLFLPATPSVRTVKINGRGNTTVKLISSGTPKYSVAAQIPQA